MNWKKWTVTSLLVASTAAKVTEVGKPREPMDHNTMAGIVVTHALLIWMVVTA